VRGYQAAPLLVEQRLKPTVISNQHYRLDRGSEQCESAQSLALTEATLDAFDLFEKIARWKEIGELHDVSSTRPVKSGAEFTRRRPAKQVILQRPERLQPAAEQRSELSPRRGSNTAPQLDSTIEFRAKTLLDRYCILFSAALMV
jgi:hypothetical protein